jgi:septum formation protein
MTVTPLEIKLLDRIPPLVLASTSRYRRELLARLRIPFEVAIPDTDETPLAGEDCAATALRLAAAKARSLRAQFPDALIIGSDQVADLDGRPLGKPGTFTNALRQLQAMRGRIVIFNTAVALFDARFDRIQVTNVPTTVTFRSLPDDQLARYLELEEPYDCAGSAKVETLGIVLTERIESTDPTALVGLPLIALSGMLLGAGFSIF